MKFPKLGQGVGLRTPHYTEATAANLPDVDWFEVVSENFFEPGGNPRRVLRTIRENFPVVMHGVALSLGSTDPLNKDYLRRLKALEREFEPAMVSDHLCWSGNGGQYGHDLLPIPFTEEALQHVACRISTVQDYLGRQILVENVSSYVQFKNEDMSEWEFLAALADKADCGILLDVNNVFVSAHNHSFDPEKYIAKIPSERIGQIHLAGHSINGELLLDTHDHAVRDEVWDLYRLAIARHGDVSTLIEWDDQIPSFDRLLEESHKAKDISESIRGNTKR